MSAQKKPNTERRQRTLVTIEKLLAERQEMLVLFCQVAGLAPYGDDHPRADLLRRFCQVLVDYIAAGHFGLYQRIAEGRERRRGVMKLARTLYPRIAETTQKVVDFNDKYEGCHFEEMPEALARDLSELGEHLAIRVELEDKIIEELRPRR